MRHSVLLQGEQQANQHWDFDAASGIACRTSTGSELGYIELVSLCAAVLGFMLRCHVLPAVCLALQTLSV